MKNSADIILYNGRINTQDPANPWASSMAISRGKILAIGDSKFTDLANKATQLIDLEKQFVMPGLIDCHVHGLWGARQALFECFVGYEASLADLASALSATVNETAHGQWITGGPWNLGHISDIESQGLTPCQWLDSISLHHPICLYDTTKHSMLVNSQAFKISEFERLASSFNPLLVGRDTKGNFDGLLHEEASGAVRAFIHYTQAQLHQAGRHMRDALHAYGITAMKEPMAFEQELQTYQQLDQQDELKLHLFSHIARSSPLGSEPLSLTQMQHMRDTYRSDNHHPDGCKLFLDGVAPSYTAAFFDPYVPCCCVSEAADKYDADALLRIPEVQLQEQIRELDEAGFTVKMHAVGDRAVNAGLNGIASTTANKGSQIRHEIAHTAFVTGTDFARFKALNAIAEVSPKIWFPTAVTAAQKQVLGKDRTNRCHPIKTLLQHGAHITYGSDWPAAVPDADPWIGMAGMITRTHPKGLYPGHVGKDQAISLDEAMTIFTRNGAAALRMEDNIGQLKAGYQADFIILNHHLDKIEPNQIADTQVLATYFAGECVYQSGSDPWA